MLHEEVGKGGRKEDYPFSSPGSRLLAVGGNLTFFTLSLFCLWW